jgi:predicted secreted protein
MIHAGGVATSIAQERMTVTKPSLDINLSTDSLVYSINDTIEISANFTNNEASEIGNLTYIIEVINTSTVDANMMILAASSSQTKTVSFTPTEEGSYVAAATLLLGFSEMASETIGFTVGSGEGLVINTVAEDLYPPEADVTLPVTIENIGTVQTVSTVNITTFDELVDFSALYTDEIGVSLDAGATTTMQLCVLPNAPPGIYQTILTAGNFSAQSVSYTVTANGTLFTILDTDKLYYNLSDSVHINITTNDVLFNATNASVNVTVTCPNGTAAYLAVSGSDGNYTATFDPASNGTYQITATSQKIGFRTYDDETFVIVGIRSTLNANLPMNNLTFNQTVYFECNITNEYDVPIDNTITTLTGCGINTTTLSDGAGTVNFVITPNATGMVTLTAEKGGFADYTSKIYVLNITQSKIIYPDFTDTDTPGNWRTWIGVMNTGDASTTLNLTIYNQDGSLAYSNPNFVTLEPKAAHFFRPGITAGIAQGSTIVYGDNLAGTCHESKNDGDGAKVYTAVTSSSPTLYYPDFTDTDTIGNWRTWLGVVNAGDTSTTVRLDVYNPDGSLAYSNANFVTLEPKAAHFFRPGITAGIAQGCVVVSGANLAGTCHVNKNGGEGTKVYTALTSGSSTLYYPDFTDTDTIGNWRTWMGVMNTGDASTTLNLTIYNPDGSLAYFDANFITLEPKAAHFFRPGITAGRAQGDVVV